MCMTDNTYLDPFLSGRPRSAAWQLATRILAGPHLSVLSTTNPDGSPQASVIFVKPDGDDMLFSTIAGRRKTLNIQRDPRVSLLVHGLVADEPEFTFATISGVVELTDDPHDAFHQVMYDLFMGGATPPPEPGAHRLVGRLRPTRVYAPPAYDPGPEQH